MRSLTRSSLNKEKSTCENRGPRSVFPPNVAPRSALGTLPGTADLPVCGEQRGSGGKPAELARIAGGPIADDVRPAPAGIFIRAAVLVTRCKRLARHPIDDSVGLPTAEHHVEGPRKIVKRVPAAAHRHLPEPHSRDHVIAVGVIRTETLGPRVDVL